MAVATTTRLPLLCAAMRDVGGNDGADLRELVSHRYVVEVLDALSDGPMTLADIRSSVHAGRRELAAAVRLVAARGLVTRSDTGSWDTDASVHAVYRHTDLGRDVYEALSRFSFWTTVFDRTGAQTRAAGYGVTKNHDRTALDWAEDR
jgi:DNA-binding HxlR family transcriptional regulator